MRRKKTLEELHPCRIHGKGWTVCRLAKGTYQAYVIRNKKNEFVATLLDEKTAVEYAVSAALKEGTLDWKKSLLWAQKKGIPLSYNSISRQTPVGSKGWYVESSNTAKGRAKCRYFAIFFGRKCEESVYQAMRVSRRAAIMYALNRKSSNPFYNEAATLHYLHRMDMEDLVPMARMQRRGVA